MIATADDAPLAFAVPPGWPTPTADWVREHQGLLIPHGWTPRPEASPAPFGWQFWPRHVPVWDRTIRPALVPMARQVWIGWGVFALGVAATAVGYSTTPSGGGYLVFWGAIVFGPIIAIRGAVNLRRRRDQLMEAIRVNAANLRISADAAAYRAYLDAGGSP